jgi:mono/diheme cytochrome c family protein
MNTHFRLTPLAACILLAGAVASAPALAKPEAEACVALGALVYDDWTSADAGGSGLPAGESTVEYVRCVSCHGWDRLGLKGGFVRRERTADHPNAGLGDLNTVSRDIAPGLGNYYEIRADEVLHEGTGRAFEDGSASWVPLDDNPTSANVAVHAEGFTLGNMHPDFSTTGANAGDTVLTQDQLDCVVDFVNNWNSDPKWYFQGVYEESNPVEYIISSGANATAGRTFYEENCLGCHGEPNQNANGALPDGGMVAFLRQDGGYSEFVHHARWGIPDTQMTRAAIGEPDEQDMIDVMLYLQEYIAQNNDVTISITGGFGGTWFQPDRDGEGFLIDVAPNMVDGDQDGWVMVATYYTYDGLGNQVWLIGSTEITEDTVSLPMQITDGGIFGELFDRLAVNRIDWGTLDISFTSCWRGHVSVTPNADMLDAGLGFEAIEFDIMRLVPPGECP